MFGRRRSVLIGHLLIGRALGLRTGLVAASGLMIPALALFARAALRERAPANPRAGPRD